MIFKCFSYYLLIYYHHFTFSFYCVSLIYYVHFIYSCFTSSVHKSAPLSGIIFWINEVVIRFKCLTCERVGSGPYV